MRCVTADMVHKNLTVSFIVHKNTVPQLPKLPMLWLGTQNLFHIIKLNHTVFDSITF